ncbi:hypothetical protein A2U01_0067407, partial [Trifolium medium]|nr:hypothetical protein [Trifolium medium]
VGATRQICCATRRQKLNHGRDTPYASAPRARLTLNLRYAPDEAAPRAENRNNSKTILHSTAPRATNPCATCSQQKLFHSIFKTTRI